MKKNVYALLLFAACLPMLAVDGPRTNWIAKNVFEQKLFIENKGQYDKEKLPGILFGARQDGLQYFFTKNAILIKHLAIVKRSHEEIEAEIKRLGLKEENENEEEKELAYKQVEQFYEMRFSGAGVSTEIIPQFEVSHTYHFGAPNKGTYIAHAYQKITYKNLYPGIDMEFYFPEDKQGFKYNFIVNPGADPSQIRILYPDAGKMRVSHEGDMTIKSAFGEFTEHAPLASELNTAKPIGCSFRVANHEMGFELENYDPAQGLIIDPWTNTPVFSGSNSAYDVDWDNAGNCYVHGGVGPFEVIKFNSAGTQLWTYSTPFTWYYGDFAVDHNSGSVYVVEGFNSSWGANVIKLYSNGTYAAQFMGNSLFQEMWRIAFSRCTNQAVIAGGGTTNPSYTGCYLDTNVTSLTPVNVINAPSGLHDMWGVALDDFGNCYMSTAQTQVGSAGYDNVLYRMPLPGLAPLAWQVNTGHLFVEVASVYTPGPGNGFNGMTVSGTNLYTYDSYMLKKWSTASGTNTGNLSVNGGSQATMSYGGLTSDDCDNIFLGLGASIVRVNGSSMSQVSSFAAGGTVYDVSLGKNNNLFACGFGWVANYNAGLSFCNSGVLNTGVTSTNATCGNSTGSATVTASGGTGPYTYNWSNGATGSVVTNLPAGTYTVIISDNSCNPQQDQLVVTITAAPSFTLGTSQSNVSCGGGSNGSAQVNISGGTPGFNVNWSNGQTGTTATGLGAGTYTVSVTDGAGCNQSTSVTITQPTPVSASGSANAATCSQSNGSASVNPSGGTGSYGYSWSPSGGTGSSATGLSPGTYTCVVTDGNGCAASAVVTVNNSAGPSASISSSSNVSCSGGSNGSAAVSVSGGTAGYTYTWSPSGGNGSSASGLPAGTYTVNITDATGCPASAQVTISQPGVLSSSASSSAALCGLANGTATVNPSGGAGGYSYSWSPSGGTGQTASGLGAGSYTCTVTDANGCTSSAVTTVNSMGGPNASITSSSSVTCNGGSNGSASASATGGTGSYTYTWSPVGGNSSTATNLPAGNYTVAVADANNCVSTSVVTISQPSALAPVTSTSSVSCNGGSNGSASISVSGGTAGYTYTWSPVGGNGTTASGLNAGTYTCNVTDANGCTTSSTAVVSQPTPVSLSGSSTTSVSCNSGSDGTATANASGGNPSYTYTWSPIGGNGATASGLPAGNYTCNISDATGCPASVALTIVEPTVVAVTPSSTPALCGQSNGVGSVSASGGSGSYTYTWSPAGGNASTASGLPAGNYTCTVADGNNCTQQVPITIANTGGPTASITSTSSVSCNGMPTGSATAQGNGGTGTYTYTWSPTGGNNATASNLPAGTYTCTIADGNNCTTTTVVTIAEPAAALSAAPAATSVTCNGGATGSASVTVSGGTAGYTYTWSPSGGNASTASALTAGNYTCDITDANGCTTNTTVTITEPTAVSLGVASTTTITCNAGNNGAASVNAAGGIPAYTYTWAPAGGNGATASGLTTGSYTCTMSDANGCSTFTTVSIPEPNAIALSISSSSVSCNGSANGSASATITGGTSAYTYTWVPTGGNNATASALAGGSYTCNITDANGCTATNSVTIAEPSAVSLSLSSTDVLCNGGTTGSASAASAGGTGSFTYTWTPSGGNSATASGLAAGSYTCFTADGNGCMTASVVTVSQPAAVSTTASSNPVGCSGGSNGSASVNVAGGITPYTINWNTTPAQSGNSATNLTAGIYIATITDANNCQSAQSVIVSEPLPKDSLIITGTLCIHDQEVLLHAPNGGTPPDTMGAPYQWYSGTSVIGGANSSTFMGSQANATSYSVTWFLNGCRYITTSVIETIYQDISTLPAVNIFTPNGDAVNDEFTPMSLSNGTLTVTYQQIADVVDDYNLYVYDRWGTLVYHSDKVLDTWTGTEINGSEASAGTYFWIAKYKTKCNTGDDEQNIRGYVQLIR
jgi:gliding motility-associated-like protein